MHKLFSSLLFLIFISGCTKEVPESDRKLVKTIDETTIHKIIENYYTSLNAGDIETAVSLHDSEFKAAIQDEDSTINFEQFENELYELRDQYLDGKWDFEVEEVSAQNDIAYVITKASFFLPDSIGIESSPVYSERSIRILKKNKPDGWKIFRVFSVQIFS